MGRNRKPDALVKLEGDRSNGKREVPRFAIEPTSGIPDAPEFLSGEASEEWKRITPVLDERGHLARVDRAALAGHCHAWGLYAAAVRDIAERGVIVPGGRNGEPVKNPSVAIARDAAASLKASVKAFGLSPAARAALPSPAHEGDGEDASVRGLFS